MTKLFPLSPWPHFKGEWRTLGGRAPAALTEDLERKTERGRETWVSYFPQRHCAVCKRAAHCDQNTVINQSHTFLPKNINVP